ncbi:MAG: hypothetical protein IJ791_01665 [Lachnospiraceae bacterium]|nr:hypothetical protein [Lachnospiraceae bacterium]
MLEHVEVLFEDKAAMMRKLKRASYEENMKKFRETYKAYLEEMLEAVSTAESAEDAAKTVGAVFADRIFDAFAVKGKVKGAEHADLNLFMIYYVFPAILLTEDPNAHMLCDGLKTAWNGRFQNTNIGYTDYETLSNSFRNKIFGIF